MADPEDRKNNLIDIDWNTTDWDTNATYLETYIGEPLDLCLTTYAKHKKGISYVELDFIPPYLVCFKWIPFKEDNLLLIYLATRLKYVFNKYPPPPWGNGEH